MGEQEVHGSGSHDQDDVTIEESPRSEVEEEPRDHHQEEVEQTVKLRRNTRLRKDHSSWVNTRVYYNAQAVEHPSQAVCSFA